MQPEVIRRPFDMLLALATLSLLGCSIGGEEELEVRQAADKQRAKPSAESKELYGAAWGANSLRNFEIGKVAGKQLAYRFRATATAALHSVRLYVKTGAGYSAGTGGSLRVELRSDDGSAGHMPSNTVLASGLLAVPSAGGWNQIVMFEGGPTLQSGALYHIVFINTDADPVANYVSINTLDNDGGNPMQPGVANEDLAVNRRIQGGSDWNCVCDGATPVFALSYGNGESQGQGYIDAKRSGALSITGNNQVREIIRVTGKDRMVSRVTIRLRRTAAAGPLKLRLERDDGLVMEEGDIPAETVSMNHAWVTYDFSGRHRLENGRTYRLVLNASAEDAYEIYPLQEGSNYGFTVPSNCSDGRFEHTEDGTNWTDFQGSPIYDMQFYFTVVTR